MSKQMIEDTQIAEAAFYIWLEEGQPAGRDMDHWIKAKTTLEQAQAKPKRRAAAKPKAAAKTAAKPKAAAKAKAPAKRASAKKAIEA